MALHFSLNSKSYHKPCSSINPNFTSNASQFSVQIIRFSNSNVWRKGRRRSSIVKNSGNGSEEKCSQDEEENSVGVKAALSMLRFYKREISPLMPNSCRYVPTCSEYSMIAYKKYGVVKGTVLTAWRLCRCNPLGGSGFDPPRWFDETTPTEQ